MNEIDRTKESGPDGVTNKASMVAPGELSELIKRTIGELRRAGMDDDQVGKAILFYFQTGMQLGESLNEMVLLLCSGPDCIARKVFYTEEQNNHFIDLVRRVPFVAVTPDYQS